MFTWINDQNRKWWLLSAMTACLAMSFLDMTAISVALPTIQRTFHASEINLQWVVNAYLLTLAMFTIMSGRVGDQYNHRNIFLSGVLVFLIGSVACALALNITWLTWSRALQGMGAAMIQANSNVLIVMMFPPEQRARAMALQASIASIFILLGPILGGALTEFISWRFIFWINLPLCLYAFFVVKLLLNKTTIQIRPQGINWLNLVLSSVVIALIITGLMQGNAWGWTNIYVLSAFVVGFVLLIIFFVLEKRATNPIIDFSIFKIKPYLSCIINFSCLQIVMMTSVFAAIFFQIVLGYTPAQAGLLSLATNLPVVLTYTYSAKLYERHGPRVPVVRGTFCMTIGLIWIAVTALWQNFYYMIPGMVIFGFGIPLITTPSMTAAMSSVVQEKRGVASGFINLSRQLSSSFGLAIMTIIVTSVNHVSLTSKLTTHTELLDKINISELSKLLLHAKDKNLVIENLSPSELLTTIKIADSSFTWAYASAVAIAAVAMGFAFFMARRLLSKTAKEEIGKV